MILATLFNRWVETDPNSVHHGADLPDEGVAIDIDGHVFNQFVKDRGWWEWEWEDTGRTVAIPLALRFAFKEVEARCAMAEKAVAAYKETERKFHDVAAKDPATAWWPGGATPGSLTDKVEADKWEKALDTSHRAELEAWRLRDEAVDKLNRLAEPLLKVVA